jgi:hypothetical protein
MATSLERLLLSCQSAPIDVVSLTHCANCFNLFPTTALEIKSDMALAQRACRQYTCTQQETVSPVPKKGMN